MEERAVELQISDLVKELKTTNDLLRQVIRTQRDWRINVRQGLLTGLGSIIGATLLVSVLVWVIQPLKRLDALKPTLEEISRQLGRANTQK